MKGVHVLFTGYKTNDEGLIEYDSEGRPIQTVQRFMKSGATWHLESGCVVIKERELPNGPLRPISAFPCDRVVIAEIVDFAPPPRQPDAEPESSAPAAPEEA